MKINFPTIKQMQDAILFAMDDVNGKCEYNTNTHTFIATENVPYPVYYGGSMDSVDFEAIVHSITFKEAYDYWRAFVDFVNGIATPLPAPIGPFALPCVENYEDFDLPF